MERGESGEQDEDRLRRAREPDQREREQQQVPGAQRRPAGPRGLQPEPVELARGERHEMQRIAPHIAPRLVSQRHLP